MCQTDAGPYINYNTTREIAGNRMGIIHIGREGRVVLGVLGIGMFPFALRKGDFKL